MKRGVRHLLVLVGTAVLFACAGTSAKAGVLADHSTFRGTPNANSALPNFAPSVDFPGSAFAVVADDFRVPPGEKWLIREITAFGSYYDSAPPAVHIFLLTDEGGQPGSAIFQQFNVGAAGPNYRVPVLVPTIDEGKYWLVVQQADGAFGGQALWSWTTRTRQSGSPAQFGSSSNTGSCMASIWSNRLNCWPGTNPDQAFIVSGQKRVLPAFRVPKTTVSSPRRVFAKGSSAPVRIQFRSTVEGSRFRCSLDSSKYRSCSSPLRRRLSVGLHKFRVYAISPKGKQDRTPATIRIRVLS